MDNSPEYIKMCEKAVEIQKGWEPIGGDWIIHDYRGTTGLPLTVEQQVWGSDDTKWNRTEILCYRPSGSKDFFVSTDGNDSHVTSAKDLLKHHVIFLPRQDQLQKMVDIVTSEDFAEKKLLELTEHHKVILKIWFVKNPKLHYDIEKFYWKIQPYFSQIKAIFIKQNIAEVEVFVVSQKPKDIEKKIKNIFVKKPESITFKAISEEEAKKIIKQDKDILSSPENFIVIYDPEKKFAKSMHKGDKKA